MPTRMTRYVNPLSDPEERNRLRAFATYSRRIVPTRKGKGSKFRFERLRKTKVAKRGAQQLVLAETAGRASPLARDPALVILRMYTQQQDGFASVL